MAADCSRTAYLLIPQGARLLGTYNSVISYGQARVQVVWTRIIFPDGSSINLDAMSGHDAEGKTGFHAQVDNHYARLIGFAVLTISLRDWSSHNVRTRLSCKLPPLAKRLRPQLDNNSQNWVPRLRAGI